MSIFEVGGGERKIENENENENERERKRMKERGGREFSFEGNWWDRLKVTEYRYPPFDRGMNTKRKEKEKKIKTKRKKRKKINK